MTPSDEVVTTQPAATPASDPETPRPESANPKQFRGMLAYACLSYIAFDLTVGLLPIPIHRYSPFLSILISFGPTVVFMLLQLSLQWLTVRSEDNYRAELVYGLGFVGVWLLAGLVGGHIAHHHRPFGIAVTTTLGLSETFGLTLLGALLSRIVREDKLLLPLAFIAGTIDIIGAMTPVGFTANAIKHNYALVNRVSVHVPAMHAHNAVSLPVLTTVGPGDVIFIGFFFAVVVRHRLNLRGTFWSVYALLTAAMISLYIKAFHIHAIGALAPLGIAVITANARYFQFSREEKFAVLYVGLMALAGALVFFLYTNAHVFHHHAH